MAAYVKFPDKTLVALVRTGDEQAFAEIYTRYGTLLYSHIYNKLREQQEAEDLVQDIFYALWAHHDELPALENLPGYLFNAARYKIADHLAKLDVRHRHLQSLQDYIAKEPELADHLVRRKQLEKLVEDEIAAMPARMQEIFRLSRYDELSHKEIAEKLGISVLTVKDQVKKALRIIRGKLGLFLFLCYLFRLF